MRTARCDIIVIETAVENVAVVPVVGDVRDVCRYVDNRHIACAGDDDVTNYGRAEIAHTAERVVAGAYVVVRVHPRRKPDAHLPSRLRRQRRPADVVITAPPRNPGRTPFISRHPAPAYFIELNPTAVVVGDSTEILVAYPGPSGIRVAPVSVGVRAPVPVHSTWLPDPAVAVGVAPVTVGRKGVVEEVEADSRFSHCGRREK